MLHEPKPDCFNCKHPYAEHDWNRYVGFCPEILEGTWSNVYWPQAEDGSKAPKWIEVIIPRADK